MGIDVPEIKKNSAAMQLVGGDEAHAADVILEGGEKKLRTKADLTVKNSLGRDDLADSYFTIDQTGAINDTWTIDIAAGTLDPIVPAYNRVITVTASEAGDTIALRDKIISELNTDILFKPHWDALKTKDNAIINISSVYRDGHGRRTTAGDFAVTVTGTAALTLGYDTVNNHNKEVSLARDPDNPNLGILGISGTVTTTPGEISKQYIEIFENGGGTSMRVNGSVTPIEFTIPVAIDEDIFVESIRIYGGGNGIKFNQFLSKSGGGGLANGMTIEIKSDDEMTNLLPMKTTEDFKNKFAFPSVGSDFRIDIQSGLDQFAAEWRPDVPFPLRKQGEFATDDYVKVIINDNLTSGLSSLEAIAFGFRKES